MKRFFVPISLFAALTLLMPLTCFAEKAVTILYAGDIMGNITPLTG